MADIDYEKFGDAIARAMKRSSSGSGAGFTGQGGSAGMGQFEKELRSAGSGAKAFGDNIQNSAGTYIDTLRTLTRSGSNFSNDIIGMGVAAAESRLSLGDFSNIVVENGKFLAGLGGSVTRGTEAFAKLSKGFFEENMTEELRQMGFTSKELNDVLAIQLGTQRATFQNDETGRIRAYESAEALAKEMDMISKLTGKNREELAEEAKKRRSDGQVEAKLRLIGIEKGPEAEAKARAAFQKQFAEAEARGMGQMAKELFATGTLTSEEAATQFALMGEAASKTRDQMAALGDGNIELAEQYSKEAQAATAKNQRDPTLLRLAALGDAAGPAGAAMQKNVEVNMALNDAIMSVSKTMQPGLTNDLKSFGTAVDLVRQNIEDSAKGLKTVVDPQTGQQVLKDVSGATRGLVALETGMQNIQAGVASSIEVQNAAGESIGNAARQLGESAKTFVDSVSPAGDNLAKYIESLVTRGQNPIPVDTSGMSDAERQSAERNARGGIPGTLGAGASDLATVVANAFSATTATISKGMRVTGGLSVDNFPAVLGRATGSIGETGNLIENFGTGTLTMLHGKEAVLTEDQLKDLALGAKNTGVAGAIDQLKSSIPAIEPSEPDTRITQLYDSIKEMSTDIAAPSADSFKSFAESMSESIKKGMQPVGINADPKEQSGLNIAKISKDISTSISSVQSSGGETTTKRVQNDDSKAAEAEMKTLSAKFKEDQAARRAIVQEGMAVEDRKFSKVQAALKLDEETIKIKEAYEKRREELAKKVAEGTTWETEQKRQSLEYIKVMIKDELSSTKGIIGKSVEGLTDDMIESMLPEGSILEDYYIDINGKLQSFVDDSAAGISESVNASSNALDAELISAADTKQSLIKKFSTTDNTIVSDYLTGLTDGVGNFEDSEVSQQPLTDIVPKELPKVDLNSFLPGFGKQLQTASATIPTAIKQDDDKKAQEAKRKEQEKAEAAKNNPAAQQTPAVTQPQTANVANLNDVVKSLNQLNMMMGKLISTTEELGSKQFRATQANNQNGFVR